MILAAAQTKPINGNIKENLKDHYRLIKIASDHGADLLVFPEMSISGYERENAHKYVFSVYDSRLDKLKELASDRKIIIIAGAAIKINTDMLIGEFILFPDGKEMIYTKQFLHTGEDQYFKSSFDYNPNILLDQDRISLAICADIDQPNHPENAVKMHSTIYIASIFFSSIGIQNAHDILKCYSLNHTLNILMANFSGQSWGTNAGGRTAFWNNNAELILEMSMSDSGLLIVEKNKGLWTGRTIID